MSDEIRPASAREALQRFNDSHWNNPGEHARYSIPPRDTDDDVLLAKFIDQAEADRAQIAALREALREAEGTRHTCTDPSGCDCAASATRVDK